LIPWKKHTGSTVEEELRCPPSLKVGPGTVPTFVDVIVSLHMVLSVEQPLLTYLLSLAFTSRVDDFFPPLSMPLVRALDRKQVSLEQLE
jgi:hypothetical protein